MTMTNRQIHNNALKSWKRCKKDVSRHWQKWQEAQALEEMYTQHMVNTYIADDWLKQMSQEYGIPYISIITPEIDMTPSIEEYQSQKEFNQKYMLAYLQILSNWNRILGKKATTL